MSDATPKHPRVITTVGANELRPTVQVMTTDGRWVNVLAIIARDPFGFVVDLHALDGDGNVRTRQAAADSPTVTDAATWPDEGSWFTDRAVRLLENLMDAQVVDFDGRPVNL